MSDALAIFTALVRSLHQPRELDAVLQRVVAAAAELTDSERASVRLLSPDRRRLIAISRHGLPFHDSPSVEFDVGEGLMGWVVSQGLALRTGDAEQDPRFAPRPGKHDRIGSFIGVPLVSGSMTLGVISAVHPTPDFFTPEHESRLTLLAGLSAPYIEMARLARLATVDPLTGALNRRGLDGVFTQSGVALVEPVAVIMADLDHFKAVNDTWGHVWGDQLLKRVVDVLAGVVRAGDAVARYGGEEFLILLPKVDLTAAARIAERAREAVAAAAVGGDGVEVKVTISMGVAARRPGEGREALIARADEALYAAKEQGRDRVVLAP
jgi:diguanylate cyclase (GGDEF)-like protein